MPTDQLRESDATRMTDDQIRAFLRREGTGVLGLSADGAPYLLPMSFGYDGDERLYFIFLRFGEESRKVELCERSAEAGFLAHRADGIDDWRSVRLTGRVAEVDEAEWPALREAMENAWHPDVFSSAHPMRGVVGYRFDVTEWSGIQYGGL